METLETFMAKAIERFPHLREVPLHRFASAYRVALQHERAQAFVERQRSRRAAGRGGRGSTPAPTSGR